MWGPDGDDWCCKETLEGHGSTVWAMSFDAAGSHFVTCSDDKTLRVWAPSSTLPADFRPVESQSSKPASQAQEVEATKASAEDLIFAGTVLSEGPWSGLANRSRQPTNLWPMGEARLV